MAQRAALTQASRRLIRPSSQGVHLVSRVSYNTTQYSTNPSYNFCQIAKTSFSTDSSSVSKTEEEGEIPPWRNPNVPKWDNRVMVEEYESGEEIPFAEVPPFDDGSGKVIASKELHDLAETIINMKLIEVHQLTRLVQAHFGFEDDDLVGGGFADGSTGDAAQEEAAEEEKTAFELKLTGFDAKSKIKVIKEVRAMSGLGLKEAKEAVEGAPKVIMKDIKKEEAEELKAKLEAVGATAEII